MNQTLLRKLTVMLTLVLFTALSTFAATNTWTNGNATNNWNDAGNWSLGTIPTNSDDVVFDATSTANCNITSGSSTLNALTFTIKTTYTGAFDLGTRTLNVYGNFLVQGAVTGRFVASTGTVNIRATSTIDFPVGDQFYDLEINAAVTDVITLSSVTEVNHEFRITKVQDINSNSINLIGSAGLYLGDGTVGGSTWVKMLGGVDQHISGTGAIGRLELNKTGGDVTYDANWVLERTGGTAELKGTAALPVQKIVNNHATLERAIQIGGDATITNSKYINVENVSINTLNHTDNVTIGNGPWPIFGNLRISKVQNIDGGDISVKGDVKAEDGTVGGNRKIILSGLADQTLSGNGNVSSLVDSSAAGNVWVAGNFGIDNEGGTSSFAGGGRPFLSSGSGVLYFRNTVAVNFTNTIHQLRIQTDDVNDDITLSSPLSIDSLTITKVDRLNGNATNSFLVSESLESTDGTVGGTAFVRIVTGSGAAVPMSGNGSVGKLDVTNAPFGVTIASNFTVANTSTTTELKGVSGANIVSSTVGAELIIDGPQNATINTASEIDNLRIQVDGTKDVSLSQDVTVNDNLRIQSVLGLNSRAYLLKGDLQMNDATVEGTSCVTFIGNATQTITGGGSLPCLDNQNTAATVQHADHVRIENDQNATAASSLNGLLNSRFESTVSGRAIRLEGKTTITSAGTIDELYVNVGSPDATNDLTLSGTDVIIGKVLTINNVDLINGKNMLLAGDLVLNDATTGGSSYIVMDGTVDQNISGSGRIGRLDVQNTTANIVIQNDVNFESTSGEVELKGASGASIVSDAPGDFLVFRDNMNLTYEGTVEQVDVTTGTVDIDLIRDFAVTDSLRMLIGGVDLNATGGGDAINLAGGLLNNGTCIGDGCINLNGGTDQYIAGNSAIHRLCVSKSGGEVIWKNNQPKTIAFLEVISGTLDFSTGLTVSNPVTVGTGGILGGSGTITGDVNINNGGVLAAGNSPGCLSIVGNLAINNLGTMEVDIDGSSTACTDYDQVIVTGTVYIHSGAILSTTDGTVPIPSSTIVVIDNDAADAIGGNSGTVKFGSNNNTVKVVGGNQYIASWTGGSGNDYALTGCLTTAATQVDVSCNGFSDGSINLTVTGVQTTITYSWSGPSFTGFTEDISNLYAGVYTVTVSELTGCSSVLAVTVTEPGVLTPSPVATTYAGGYNITCNGASDGAIFTDGTNGSSVTGGTTAYSYLWSTGATTENITGLIAGAYTLTVTDAQACVAVVTVTLTQPAVLVYSGTFVPTPGGTNVSCFGASDGYVDGLTLGGTSAYTYVWSHGPTTESVSGLSVAGSPYSATVTDANGCTAVSGPWTMVEPPLLVIGGTPFTYPSGTNISCNGLSDGSIAVTTTGGSTAYSWSWTGPSGYTASTESISGVPAGEYAVTVTDVNGCTDTYAATLTEPALLGVTLTDVSTYVGGWNISCYGANTGSIDMGAFGGNTAYSYNWNWTLFNTNTGSSSQLDLVNRRAGDYHLTVTDINGCTATYDITLTQPDQLIVDPEKHDYNGRDLTCFGASDGVLYTDGTNGSSVIGGTTAYTYLWSTGETTENISGLSNAGSPYRVTVTDANGCTDQSPNFTMQNPPLLVASSNNSYRRNVQCNGESNGRVGVTVSGGTNPKSYLWSNNVTTQNNPNIPAGDYTVTVTDINGCSEVVGPIGVYQPDVLLANGSTSTYVGGNQISCNGAADAWATVNPTGGRTPYNYRWTRTNPGGFTAQTTQSISGLSPGYYRCRVRDSVNWCEDNFYVTITEPAPLLAFNNISQYTQNNISCNGESDGWISTVVTGGITAYSYAWSNGATTANISGLPAGTYTLTTTDVNLCVDIVTLILTEPDLLVATATSPQISGTYNISCFGESDGSIALTVTGGQTTSAYSYSWSNGATTEDQTGLPAGVYDVTVTDVNMCEAFESITLTEPPLLVAPGVPATYAGGWNISCNGESDGSIDLSPDGGPTSSYSYAWTGPGGFTASTQDVSGLIAGTYDVTVTDLTCSTTSQFILTEPPLLTTSGVPMTYPGGWNISCFGESDGSIDLSVAGGPLSAYTYSWTGPGGFTATTQDISGLPTGQYDVTVTDASCTTTYGVSLTEPPLLEITGSTLSTYNGGWNISCFGESDGDIDIDVAGGPTSGYVYSWTGPSGFTATTQDVTGLFAGAYSVTVTDETCTTEFSVTLTEPDLLVVTGGPKTYNGGWNISCFGLSDGEIYTDGTLYGGSTVGGTPPYIYSWSTGATTANVTGLPAGAYSVSVTDQNGCFDDFYITLTEPPLLEIPTVTLSTYNGGWNVGCYGFNNGSAEANPIGGTMPYTYLWSDGQTTKTAMNLYALQAYTVTVTDANGCTEEFTTPVLTEPGIVVVYETFSNYTPLNTNISCNGASDGWVDITPGGGTSPWTYLWSNGATTQDVSGLAAGPYTVTVTDANGCTVYSVRNYNLTEPDAIEGNEVITNVTCNGLSTGAIDLTTTGGAGSYTWLWSNGMASDDISGLSAGVYTVTITDLIGCTAVHSYTVTEPAGMMITSVLSDYNGYGISCHGTFDGNIDITVTGGTTAYSYLWSNWLGTEDLSGVGSGVYSVTVTDANGCTATHTVTLTEPAELLGFVSVSMYGNDNISCNGGNDGWISAGISGGVTPFAYNWSNGLTTSSISGLTAGTYSLTITDANGCVDFVKNIVLSEPALLTASATSPVNTGGYNISCNGVSDGSIDLTVAGGTTAYSYAWSNGAVSEDQSGLPAGIYSVTVTDDNGCVATTSITLTEPPALNITASNTNVSCNGQSDATASASATGGKAPYSYAWSNGANGQSVAGLTAGIYTVTVTDVNGCWNSSNVTVTEPAAISLTSTITDVLCYGNATGGIDISVSGGTPGYTFAWSNGASSEDLTSVVAGTYSLLITDANGCKFYQGFTINEPTQLTASATSTDVDCYGASNGTVTLTVGGGTTGYTYLWNNGSTDQNLTGLSGGTYSVVVTDFNNCTATASATVAEPAAALVATVTSTNIDCNGRSNGTAGVSATGGTAPYSYAWSTGANTQSLGGLTAGTYGVTVTDANGCTTPGSTTITEPAALVATGVVTNVLCNGASTGAIDLTITGGTTAYTIAWSNGASSDDLTGLAAGTYNVIVTDANGCKTTAGFTVTQPTALTASATSTDVDCYGASNGTVTLTVGGGTAGYTYLWNNGSTDQNLTGLSGGTYSVVVTDFNNCTATASATVAEPAAALAATVTSTNIACNGNSTGTAGVSATGGTAPYSYAWSTGASTQSLGGLTAGTYGVTVTDANGCTTSGSTTIAPPVALVATGTVTDVLCNGASTGAIDLTVTGGNTAYSFSWSNGASSKDLTGLTAGTYSVIVTDANGCITSKGFTLTQPTLLTASATSIDVTCNGASDGSIDLTVVGGTTVYSFSWSNGSTDEDLSGLTAGTYGVTVTDANGCTATTSITISEPPAISITTNSTNISCNGASDGTASAQATGGTAPYTYLWSTGGNGQSIANVPAGIYSVTVTDANGCSNSTSVTITQPDVLATSSTQVDVLCYGGNNASIDLTVTGGTTAYSFAWSNGATSEDVSELTAGSYSVVVTDANGCSTIAFATIAQPTRLTSSATSTDVDCYGASNGTVTLTVGGGTAGYTYLWNNGSTDQNLTGLSGGTYSVVVTDANGCTATASATVAEPAAALAATATSTNIDCNGNSNGTAAVVASGGTAPYSYAWSNGAGAQSLGGLVAGTYDVTVTDANGCTTTSSTTITQPAVLASSTTQVDVLCYGGNNASINLTVTGGTTAYSFSWSNGATSEDVSGLTAGNYMVVITDANNCTDVAFATISQPTRLTASASSTDVDCYGASNGTVTLTVGGGTTGYSYAWSNGSTDMNLTGLSGGTYDVTVTDFNNCTATASATVAEPAAALAATATSTNINCYGGSNGTAAVVATGGTAPYSYAWSNGAGAQSLGGLTAGTYDVTVTDANGCTTTASTTITQPAAIALSSTTTDNNGYAVSCFGGADGGITLTVTGGTAPYSYLWSNASTAKDQSGLSAGLYSVIVTDVNGCTKTLFTNVTQPTPLVVSGTVGNVSCNTGNDGSITLTVTGGVTSYDFEWSDGPLTQNRTNLTAGNYNVTVTDANGCEAIGTYVVTQPTPLTASIVGTNVSCNNGSDGTADLTVGGGTAPYTYMWSNGTTTQDLAGIPAGSYKVTVTDDNTCTATASVVISQPTALTVGGTSTNVTCYGVNDGTISITVGGGTPGYSYAWSHGVINMNQTNLYPGAYTVTITDANGCTITYSATITEPALLTASATSTDVDCYGGSNGTATLTVAGGTIAYNYAWNNGATTQNLTGLVAGTYSVTVTDDNGCTATASTTVNQPTLLTASATATDALCYGSSDGSATVTAGGGTPAYTYLWSNGATDATASNIPAGTYDVTVTDNNGCTATASATVGQPTMLSASATSTNIDCNGNSNGTAAVVASGGTAPYSYAWSNGAGAQSLGGLVAGTYDVTVTDANGCTTTSSTTITQPAVLASSTTQVDVLCYGGNNASINLTVTGGTTAYSFSWSNGATSEDVSGLTAGNYMVVITDANNCTDVAFATISQPTRLTASASSTDVDCYGASNGTVTLTVGGGTTGYSYAWSNGSTDMNLTGLSGGTYDVTVTDFNNCTATASATVAEPTMLTASASATSVACSGNSTGTAAAVAAGGTAPYSYSWSNGAGSQSIGGLTAGTYDVTVTDANGCTATASTTVTAPATLVATGVVTDVTCYGATSGSIDLTITGGATAYTVVWSNGASTADISGLAAGTYNVVVTDANGCITTAGFTVTQPTRLTASATSTNVDCYGASNGTVTLTVGGGTTGYSYAWSNGSTDMNLTALSGGTYSVTVTDANSCTATASAVVTEPAAALTASASATSLACNGNSTGTATVVANGGTAPYSYSWSNGAGSQSLGGLTIGTYDVTVTDANGCTATSIATVTAPVALVATGVVTDVTCYGGVNGSINLSVTGGVTAYGFVWSTGASTEDVSGLAAGSYLVNITDANGCVTSKGFTVTEPTRVTASTSVTDVTCYGYSNGTATVVAGGGTPGYTYMWSNGATDATATGLAAGTYSVTVSDNNSCTAVATATVNQPTAIVLTTTQTNVGCAGGADGTATVSVTGGTPSYNYNWSSGATSATATGLAAGVYGVTVTDANSCTATTSVTITEPLGMIVTSVATTYNGGWNVTCNGGNDGTINTTVTGGTAPYSYSWTGPNSYASNTEDPNALYAGTYSLTVTDGKGCTSTHSVTITEPTAVLVLANETNITCNGAMDGTATLTVSGGTTGYSYFWKGPGTFTATTKDLTGLKKGMYLVFVTDANGCSDMDIVFIDEPAGMTLSSTAYMYTGGNNISCNGESDGSIDLTVAGGTPSYTYNWNNGATTQDLSGLAAGTYTVTVTDGNGCTKVHSRTLTQPAPLSATQSLSDYNGQNISCFGESDGTIKLYPAGGSGPYIYAWNTGSNADTLWNLPAGVYTVTLTDLNSCQIVHNITLTEPDLLIAVGTPKTYNGGWNIACYGESNGEIAMAPTGGTTPYSYTWSNGQTGATATGLPVGSYSVTVVDVNGCTDYNSWTLTEPDTLIADGTPKTYNGGWNISCYGESDGEIDLTVTGGTTAYAYNWSNGATTQDVSGLPAGPYSVTVTDANNCMDTYYVTLTQPDSLIANGTPKTYNGGWNISCYGESDGEIDLTVTGGTTAYNYNWSNGATTQDVSGLPAGPYSVTVTDANNCMDTYYVTLTEPAPLVASGTPKTYNGGWNISCYGESDGEIDLTVTGGTTAYVYNWSNGATTQDVSGLPAGPYSVTVTDANNCMDTYYVTLTQPDLLVANVAQTDTGCVGADANEITITAAGGTAAYLYSIDGGTSTSTANVFTGLAPGTYNIYVSDANGCTATNTIRVVDYAKPVANAGPDSTWYVGYAPAECLQLNGTASNGTAGYSYSWSNGATTDTTTVCYSGSASETFTLIVTDVNGCKDTDQVTIDTMDVRCTQPVGYNYVRLCARVAGTSRFQTLCVAQNVVPYYFTTLDASWGPCPIPKDVESYSVMDAYKVYPNPSNGIFNIEAYNEFENDRVIVYDAVGKSIIDRELNGKVEQVDMSIYNTGVYYMQISVGGFVKTTKVILH